MSMTTEMQQNENNWNTMQQLSFFAIISELLDMYCLFKEMQHKLPEKAILVHTKSIFIFLAVTMIKAICGYLQANEVVCKLHP